MDANLDGELRALVSCYQDIRFGLAIYYSSFAIFMFDFLLTFGGEVHTMWRKRRISVNLVFFYLTRYIGLACVLLVTIWPTPTETSERIAIALRIAVIASSEVILAIRTWAMWDRSKRMAWALGGIGLACVGPAAAFIVRDGGLSRFELVSPNLSYLKECYIIKSGTTQGQILPYILAIVFEIVTFSLCIFKVVQMRQATGGLRIPLAEKLWQHGMFYYASVLLLSLMNIVVVVQSPSPELRSGAAHLQAALHSVIATRILMHLASTNLEPMIPHGSSNIRWPIGR